MDLQRLIWLRNRFSIWFDLFLQSEIILKADFVNECQHEDKKAQHGSPHIQRILKGVFFVVIELKKVLIVKRKGKWYNSFF